MESLGPLVQLILWLVSVPLIVFVVLKLLRFDFQKPWLKWRTEDGPLPLWVYAAGTAGMLLVLLLIATAHAG